MKPLTMTKTVNPKTVEALRFGAQKGFAQTKAMSKQMTRGMSRAMSKVPL